jgi:lipoyl(octanoyl) transferase
MAAVLAPAIRIKQLGRVEYLAALEAMRRFTAQRNDATGDELWLLEHPPVYTLGLAADAAHGPRTDRGIPVVQVERGGEITYHGPGQVVLYTLVDLARRALKVREFVAMLEGSVIDLLAERGVDAARRPGAPGVDVDGAKIAALGIRVARGRAFHGLALNVDLDLRPFGEIDPCGYPGLAVTRTSDLGIAGRPAELGGRLAQILAARLGHA